MTEFKGKMYAFGHLFVISVLTKFFQTLIIIMQTNKINQKINLEHSGLKLFCDSTIGKFDSSRF